jgi:hypothetical protein
VPGGGAASNGRGAELGLGYWVKLG